MAFSLVNALYSIVVTFAGYYIFILYYRLELHPLSKFPGPTLAALSSWYEFYFDVVKRGRFLWEIERMHEEYGPIVRINPEELHINDPEFYDELYGSATRKRDKYADWMMSGTDGSSFSTVDHSHHRLRRSALNPFFSKKAVVALEPMIQEKVDKLCHRFSSASKTGEIIRADAAFVALTMDVISKYCFARDDDYLSEPDFKVAWKETLRGAFESVALRRQFPWMLSLMKMLPQSLVLKINPSFKLIFDWKASIEARIKPILDRTEPAPESQNASHRSVFHELRDSSLPPQEKTLERLSDEGQIFIGAGTETTATTLSKVTFYLLTNKQVLDKLRTELRTVMPNPTSPVSVTRLEQLLYLSAVIAEALRLSISVSTRLPRIATEETLTYKEWTIPSGTPVSESQYFVLMNKDIFPSPTTFDPGRWLNADGTYNHTLEKYLVSFGRGTRQCLGMNLANAELFLTTARLFRRFEMELYETTVSDIDMAHDFFSPVPRLDSKGVRVRVLGEVKE